MVHDLIQANRLYFDIVPSPASPNPTVACGLLERGAPGHHGEP